ncbi:GNAT family N-acetyltransferase [Thermomonospora umbrina]|uniref:Putative acetyltransferase n=1 Tax=Thermomonospora umbrina TaxID=111806 RepID=A0A3D9SX11_9ACTN|nr:GNAT family N-acetyltransferase [Thermomonospora umbrina]REF00118.1 putative acetyltransferase [Thermomonospora umbrina]
MVTVRDVPESEIDQVIDLTGIAFHERVDDGDDRERHRWLLRGARRLGAYEDGRLVGFVGGLPMRMSVPGGSLACVGVTDVVVLPTHRRRGVLSAMIGRLYEDLDAPLAALYASEGAIYGRYGFGHADHAAQIEIDTVRPWTTRIEPAPRPLRMVSLEEAPKVLAPLYERAAARRPGQFLRDEEWWRRWVLTSKESGDDALTEPRVVVMDDAGYVIYRTKLDEESDDLGRVRLMELEGDDARVEAALWRYLASIDLTGRIRGARPVDDLVPLLAADPDTVRITRTWQALWVRLADVGSALQGRGWAEPVDTVLRIVDTRIPANDGHWRLRVTGDDATCERTDAAPDLTLDVRELGTVYLGDTALATLVRAGLVTEHAPGAASRLDRALSVPRAPFTSDDF